MGVHNIASFDIQGDIVFYDMFLNITNILNNNKTVVGIIITYTRKLWSNKLFQIMVYKITCNIHEYNRLV